MSEICLQNLARRSSRRGMTLTEVLIASSLALGVVLGLGSLDVFRVRVHEELLRRQGQVAFTDRMNAALAAVHIARVLERADRVAILPGPPAVLQVRIPQCPTTPPAPACFDNPANYTWTQYQLNGNELRLYSFPPPGCGTHKVLSREIGFVTFVYANEAPPPPGGDPPPPANDNNVIRFELGWTKGVSSRTYRGEVTSRASAYTDVATGLQAPDVVDLSPPPVAAACP